MPNEKEGNDPGQHDQPDKGWHNQGRQGRNQRRQGNRGADQQRGRQARFEGREPRLQGHIYDWTGERTTSELHGKSAPTSESSTPSTRPTSQRPWIPWT